MSSSSEASLERGLEWAFLAVSMASAAVSIVAALSTDRLSDEPRSVALAVLDDARGTYERGLEEALGARRPMARSSPARTASVATRMDPVVIRSPQDAPTQPAPRPPAAPAHIQPEPVRRPAAREVAIDAKAKARSEPKPTKKPTHVEASVPARLASLGVSTRDIERVGLGEKLARWSSAAEADKTQLEDELDRALLSEAFLDRLFSEAADALDRRAGDASIAAEENEYLTLRTARRPGLDENGRRGLRRRLLALRAALR
ncbi:MAG: hypothetical protein HY791_34105 [Deltaproteobacteria bacterium]|nr:hypothetical protein [Deltaproteobacteria bacterium]